MTDGTMGAPAPARIPLGVKLVLGVVVFQAVTLAVGGWAIVADVQNRVEHGQDSVGLTAAWFGAVISFLLAAGLITSVFLARRRFRWIRYALVSYEGLAVLAGLVPLFAGAGVAALITLGPAVWVLTVLLGARGRGWFRGRPAQPAWYPAAPVKAPPEHRGDGEDLGR